MHVYNNEAYILARVCHQTNMLLFHLKYNTDLMNLGRKLIFFGEATPLARKSAGNKCSVLDVLGMWQARGNQRSHVALVPGDTLALTLENDGNFRSSGQAAGELSTNWIELHISS